MTRYLPDQFQFWEAQQDDLTVDQVIDQYERGFAGAYDDPEEESRINDELVRDGGIVEGADIAHEMNFAESGAGKLTLMFIDAAIHFPGCWPGVAQQVGDCVSHGCKNAALMTVSREITAKTPDEVTGKIEGIPELSSSGISQGVISSEWIYWFRGHGGHGWYCPAAAEVARKTGLMLRKNHDEINLDLTEYSGRKASRYGRSKPPENYQEHGRKHVVRTHTNLRSREERRDFLAAGKGVFQCGGEGFSRTRGTVSFYYFQYLSGHRRWSLSSRIPISQPKIEQSNMEGWLQAYRT